MAATYFISDAHFGAGTPTEEHYKIEKLISFFRTIQHPGNQLYLVGDFFDVWFEYKHAIPNAYFPILKALADLKEHGVQIDYIVGNHDGWIHDFFPLKLGIAVHRAPVDIQLDSKRVYLAHGHGILNTRWRDKLLKKIIDHPLNIFLYRLLPPDVALPLAKKVSTWSRERNQEHADPDDIKGLYLSFAQKLLAQEFDAVILGHTHAPRIHYFGERVYMNLGEWIKKFSYGCLNQGTFTLEFW